MLKKTNDRMITANKPKKLTVKTFLASHPQFDALVTLLGVPHSNLRVDIVDGGYVIDGRFSLTAKTAQAIYTNYRFEQNRNIKESNAHCMVADMNEGKWSNVADPGIQFTINSGRLVMSDGHHRIVTAKGLDALNDNPLYMKFMAAAAPLEQVYIKVDRGAAKSVKVRNMAAKFPDRLALSDKATNRLTDIAIAAMCEGRSQSYLNEKVSFERDESRFEIMKSMRDAFVRIRELAPDVESLEKAEILADYGGLFTANHRWLVMSSRAVLGVLTRLMTDQPDMADEIFTFAQRVVDFEATESQNISTLSNFLSNPLVRTGGTSFYEITYNAALICLRDFLAGNRTDGTALMSLVYATAGLRKKESDTWASNSTNAFEDVSVEVTVGSYTKMVQAFQITNRITKKR